MIKQYTTKYSLIYNTLRCPKDIIIPVNDIDAWSYFPEFNWVYNKIKLCQSQKVLCGPIGTTPEFPIIIKPIINLFGMGFGSRIINNISEYNNSPPGYFWMPLLKGDHLSYDFILVRGKIQLYVCFKGHYDSERFGAFKFWETLPHNILPKSLEKWIANNLGGETPYTGCINFETINNIIIDCHLRMGDINQFHDNNIMENIIKVYKGIDIPDLSKYIIPKIYLVPIFIDYNSKIYINSKELRDTCNKIDPESNYIYSYQLDPPQENSFNPIGGVRIANINTSNLQVGLMVKEEVLKLVSVKETKRRLLIASYILVIIFIIIITKN